MDKDADVASEERIEMAFPMNLHSQKASCLTFVPKSLLINEPIFKLTSLGTFTIVASPLLKPEQAQDPSNSHLFFEDLSDGHSSINQFLTSLITDTRHKGSRLADQTQFLKSEHKDGILNNPL